MSFFTFSKSSIFPRSFFTLFISNKCGASNFMSSSFMPPSVIDLMSLSLSFVDHGQSQDQGQGEGQGQGQGHGKDQALEILFGFMFGPCARQFPMMVVQGRRIMSLGDTQDRDPAYPHCLLPPV